MWWMIVTYTIYYFFLHYSSGLYYFKWTDCSIWATVCKTIRLMLSDRCPVFLSVCLSCPVLSCLSVCNVRVLWLNGWIDQYENRHGGRPRPRPHCVRWGPSSPQKGADPPISAHLYCGQAGGRIKMPLDTEAGLGPGHIVLHGDPDPPKGAQLPIFGPCLLWTNGRPSQLLLSTCSLQYVLCS